MKKIIGLLLLVISISIYFNIELKKEVKNKEHKIQYIKKELDISLNDNYYLFEYSEKIKGERDSLKSLYHYQLNNPKIVYREIIKQRVDTVKVAGGVELGKIYRLNFNTTQYLNGASYQLNGWNDFVWDFDSNKPKLNDTNIVSFDMRLNVRSEIYPIEKDYKIVTNTLSPNIIINYNENNIITERDYIKKVPTRFSVGLVGGVGFTYHGITPYAGIGITYSFYDLTKFLQK